MSEQGGDYAEAIATAYAEAIATAALRIDKLERMNQRLHARIAELEAALRRIRDQKEPQHPTGTWARDVARAELLGRPEETP